VQLDLPVIVGETHSPPLCADGWHGSAGGEERDGGKKRQDRRPASPYA
jgi:hypothetical protein